ncbi:MAG: hypothetical protein HY791_14475 [Deltaproteobacteria bacterium]|nr:hypothetical protein [Deltaproteobacteria bacterium]
MATRITGSPVSTPMPAEPAPVAEKKGKAGFEAGKALPDDKVWDSQVGRGRALDTASAHGKGAVIDTSEQKALAQIFVKSPKEFFSRLRADSLNGTPVKFGMSKELKGFGILRLDINVDKANIDAKVTVDVYKKTANGFLGAYIAKKGDEGMKPQIELSAKGKLTTNGIEGSGVELALKGLPKFSAEKLAKLDQLKKELDAALKADGTPADKEAKVKALFDELIGDMSDLPIPFLVKLVTSSEDLSVDLKLADKSAKAHADLGNGKYALTIDDILGEDKPEEVDLGAKVAGTATEDGTITVDEARVFMKDAVGVRFDSKDKPHFYKKDDETGKKTTVNEHAGEIAMLIPMALALTGGDF